MNLTFFIFPHFLEPHSISLYMANGQVSPTANVTFIFFQHLINSLKTSNSSIRKQLSLLGEHNG